MSALGLRSFACDLREAIAEQRDYRELLIQMTKRDFLLRYKQTVMGFGWAVFMPVLNTVIFSVIFTRVAPLDVGIPYPLYAFCGLLLWNFLASSLRFAVNSLTTNTNLVTKVYFPREILPFSAIIVSLADLALASIILVGLMAYYGVAPSWTVVALPAVLLVHVAFTCAIALLLAMSNAFFRDVRYVFEVVVQIWMFATSVLYPAGQVDGVVGAVLSLNPVTAIVDACRDVVLFGRLPGADFAVAAVVSVLLLMWSWTVFHRAEFRFAENI
jgi:ABC-type polysaccharide/polyol phosphate export permease